jgi:hypothetical protein
MQGRLVRSLVVLGLAGGLFATSALTQTSRKPHAALVCAPTLLAQYVTLADHSASAVPLFCPGKRKGEL